jgi:endonuclease-3
MDTTLIDWDAIIATLAAWAEPLEPPSVTALALEARREPWAVLASTILSLRTKDAVTRVASDTLLKAAPTPAALLALSSEAIERLIYPVGFYRVKARTLLEIASLVMTRFGGTVPDTLEELLTLPGVGRKTANLVLIEAFNKDGLCVDTHVHRIANRIGWVATKTPDKTEMALRRIMPRRYWSGLNALLVRYGQLVCRPQSPLCSRCVIAGHCKRVGVERSR